MAEQPKYGTLLRRALAGLTLGVALLSGCAGDPDHDAAAAALAGADVVPYAAWSGARAGCEGMDLASLHLAGVEGEPLLAALVRDNGSVACVDAISILIEELELGAVTPLEDPSPQPSDPTITPFAMEDPTPPSTDSEDDGELDGDPTPTPMYGDIGHDPTPTPMYPGDPDHDPTPTPMWNFGPGQDPTPTPM